MPRNAVFPDEVIIREALDETLVYSTFASTRPSENIGKWHRELSVCHVNLWDPCVDQLLNHSSAQTQSPGSDYLRDKMLSRNNYVLWGENGFIQGPLYMEQEEQLFRFLNWSMK